MNMSKYLLLLLPLVWGVASAQMPVSPDISGRPPQPGEKAPSTNEPTNPHLFGMEIPLLDPATDTVSYNGGHFDVGNNAAVRARFETWLQQVPDDSAESRTYRERMAEILRVTRRSGKTSAPVGSEALVLIGRGLYDISNYPGDGNQAGVLASAIVSVLDAQRANLGRERRNEKLDEEIRRLVIRTNHLTNNSTMRYSRRGNAGGEGATTRNSFTIAHNTKEIAAREGEKVKNAASNEAALLASKANYQACLVSFLIQRRFDHAVIGARIYRHLFRDGDTRLNIDEKSDASKIFMGIGGMPPTVNTMDSLASNARRSVDQHIEAVYGLLAQNKLGEATQHLIEAVAIGEYMQSVATFPASERRRVAQYWNLRKRALTALNARDYGNVEEIARQMKALDEDFDDSMLLSYCAGKKRQSDLCLRNAMKAYRNGKEEEFNRQITEAGLIWPRNPNLDVGEEKLKKLDNNEPVLEEFRTLYERKDYRTIYEEQERFEVVAVDAELKKQYKEVITLISTIDAMLRQLDTVALQDRSMGPCVAYEKLVEYKKEDERCALDRVYIEALNRYSSLGHEFVQALRDAESCEKRREFGSALSCYYRAQCIYPNSTLARKGAARVTDIIVKAQY